MDFKSENKAIEYLNKNFESLFEKYEALDSVGVAKSEDSFYLEGSTSRLHHSRLPIKHLKSIISLREMGEIHLVPKELIEVVPFEESFNLNLGPRFPLIRPGIQINRGGKISAIVEIEGKKFIMSNHHVLKKSIDGSVTLKVGDFEIDQKQIAKYKSRNLGIDIGFAELTTDLAISNIPLGAEISPSGFRNPRLHESVIRYWRKGEIEGVVKLINIYTRKTNDQTFFEIQPVKVDVFTSRGDSGSLIVSKTNPEICLGIHRQAAIRHENPDDRTSGSFSIPIELIKSKKEFKF